MNFDLLFVVQFGSTRLSRDLTESDTEWKPIFSVNFANAAICYRFAGSRHIQHILQIQKIKKFARGDHSRYWRLDLIEEDWLVVRSHHLNDPHLGHFSSGYAHFCWWLLILHSTQLNTQAITEMRQMKWKIFCASIVLYLKLFKIKKNRLYWSRINFCSWISRSIAIRIEFKPFCDFHRAIYFCHFGFAVSFVSNLFEGNENERHNLRSHQKYFRLILVK